MSQPIFRGVATALITPMHEDGSLNVERLRSLGMEDDIRFCLQEDVMDAVPCYVDGVIRDSYA